MKKFLLFLCAIVLLSLQSKGQTVKDIDGNEYNTVTIGTQVWMKENLKTTKLNDGTPINVITDKFDWVGQTGSARCWYNNDSAANHKAYGFLYNGHIVITNKICPENWHIPSADEWVILINYLGGDKIAGSKMKDTSSLWITGNKADNSSGFSALPGGNRYDSFQSVNVTANLYVYSTSVLFYTINLSSSDSSVDFWIFSVPYFGASIRCIKDTTSSIIENPSFNLRIYPSPATEALFISSDHNLIGEVEVFNPMGEKVLRQSIPSNSASIDISALKTGVYFVLFKNNSGSFQQKFMKL